MAKVKAKIKGVRRIKKYNDGESEPYEIDEKEFALTEEQAREAAQGNAYGRMREDDVFEVIEKKTGNVIPPTKPETE